MKTLRDILPRASQSVIDLNPAILTPKPNKNALQATPNAKKRGSMNRTESEFALILEAQKRKGEILRYEPFGITLRWPCGTHPKTGAPIIIRYTPDFVVFVGNRTVRVGTLQGLDTANYTRMKLIEVKGAFTGGKFERAIERFRHARTFWPEFMFEMHQKKGGLWKQVL